MTIYLPADLANTVKEHSDLNASAICQGALRRELARREEIAKLAKGMNRVVVYVEDFYEADVAFYGKELYCSGKAPEMTVYLTRNHRIAVYDNDAQALYQYEPFDEFANFDAWRNGSPDVVAAVAANSASRTPSNWTSKTQRGDQS